MTTKFQRPAGAYSGASGLGNRTKYQDDANAVPKRAISSSKVDGDLNYVIDGLNLLDEASGTRPSIADRLDVSLNPDGTLKMTTAGALDEFVVHVGTGTLARVDNSTFTLAGGDFRGVYLVNRRIKVSMGATTLVGDVASVAYSGGLTTVGCVDMVDSAGAAANITATPTQVAYGPLTPGVRGNVPRKTDALAVMATGANYTLVGDTADLVIKRSGSTVVRVTSGGISGLAAASVGTAAFDAGALALMVPAGAVMPFAGTAAPSGWLLCYGQAVSRATYAVLFTAIGTAFGAGDGSTTFNLPDLRGRLALGLDNMGGTDAGRLSIANTLGATGGSQTKSGSTDGYALTVADIPAHVHYMQGGLGGTGTNGATAAQATPGTGTLPGSAPTSSVGGSGSHSHTITNLDVLPPYVLLNHIIKV